MTTKKKIYLAIAAFATAVVLVLVSVFTTMAYLMGSSAVSNTFTVGNVTIDMKESKVDETGKIITGAGAEKVDGNSYKLINDKKYDKDPVITVKKGSTQVYLFIVVKNEIRSIEIQTETADKKKMRTQIEANGWKEFTPTDETKPSSNLVVYAYYGKTGDDVNDVPATVDAVDADLQIPLFTYFVTDPNADVTLYGSATVKVSAYAIQGETFTDLQAAWKPLYDAYHETMS